MLTRSSYAKINWTLEVRGRRPDGYHELRTILQTVDLADTLTFSLLESGTTIECEHPEVPTDERNLVWKAAQLLRERTGKTGGVRIRIAKRIPTAAGLGGGSSNAAVTLLALIQLWNLDIPWTELVEIAGRIGADVPFFLIGGTCLGVGRGDEVYPLAGIEARHLLLLNPGILVPTREVYANLPPELTNQTGVAKMPFSLELAYETVRRQDLSSPDTTAGGLPGEEPANGDKATGIAAPGSVRSGVSRVFPAGLLHNDLEASVLPRYPKLAASKGVLRSLGATEVLMSGSGSTIFAIFDNDQARQLAATAMRADGWWVEPVRTIGSHEYLRQTR